MTTLRHIAVLGAAGEGVEGVVGELADLTGASVSVAQARRARRADLLVLDAASLPTSGPLPDALANVAERPVLVVPEGGWESPVRPHLLVGIQDEDRVAQGATRLARALGGRLTLVHVVDEFSTDLAAALDRGWLKLASAVRLVDSGIPVSAKVLIGDPADELLAAAEESNTDFIVVGARYDARAAGDGASMAARLLDEPSRPVLVLPA